MKYMGTSYQQKIDLYEKGYTQAQIAEKLGISKQAVSEALARRRINYFKPISEKQCKYRNIRKWMNENKVSIIEIVRRFGLLPNTNNHARVRRILCGDLEPRKIWLIEFSMITGLPVETLFEEDYEEVKNCVSKNLHRD